jgi:hypothetical protein
MNSGDIGNESFCKGIISRIERLLDIIGSLESYPPSPTDWPQWLERCTATLAHYEGLLKSLSAAENLLLLPMKSSEFIPNEFLRTKLDPSVEAFLEEQFKDGGLEEDGGLFGSLARLFQQTAEEFRAGTGTKEQPKETNEDLNRALREFYTAHV